MTLCTHGRWVRNFVHLSIDIFYSTNYNLLTKYKMKPIENKNYLSITQGTSIRAKLVCIVLLLIVGLLSTAFGMKSQHKAEESGILSMLHKKKPEQGELPINSMPLTEKPEQGEHSINLGDLLNPKDIQSLTLAQIVEKIEQGITEQDLFLSTKELIEVICKQLQQASISYTEEEVARLLTGKITIEVFTVSRRTPLEVTVHGEPVNNELLKELQEGYKTP